MKNLSIEEKAKRYDEAIEKAEKWHNAPNVDKIPTFGNRIIEDIFPELYESEDERIKNEIIDYISTADDKVLIPYESWIAWLEKQGDKPLFTYDDILALQCCMETSKKVQGDKELYEQLQSLHDRLHDAYWLEKQGRQKYMKVYRVENEAEQKGLWRKFDGTYEPLFDMLTDGQCKDLPMEDSPIYREGGKRWFASAPSKETLQKWFSKKDLEELVSKGFTISEFEVVGYKKVSDFEYIFTRDNIINRNYLEVSDIYPEQKVFAPKVEPKFKVGDWVVNKLGDVWHIDSFDKKNYQVSDGKGNYNYFPISKQDEMHLWTIQDAKDGDILAWLTKQSKQQPRGESAPEVIKELKYKDGDWIVYDNNVYKIVNIPHDNYYECLGIDNTIRVYNSSIDDKSHLWTIKDAKAGDVLYYNDDIIVIFKYFHDDSSFCSYCYIDGGVFFTSNDRTPVWWMNNVFYPATKEQSNILFAKMEEKGYEWDSNKKELVGQMTDEKHKQYMLEHQDETIYDMSFEEAQDYISKRGFDIPWNDGDVMVDERKLTQTVANVLKWADRHPLMLPYKKK